MIFWFIINTRTVYYSQSSETQILRMINIIAVKTKMLHEFFVLKVTCK